MYVFQTSERHRHPTLNVGVLKDECLVSNHSLQIGVEELEDEVDVLFQRKDVE
jgi:hypothetical protein